MDAEFAFTGGSGMVDRETAVNVFRFFSPLEELKLSNAKVFTPQDIGALLCSE